MQLPQYKKKKRIKLKVCQFPGCGIEFWGHPISKYCPEHHDIKLRLKKKKEEEAKREAEALDYDENNLILDYEPQEIEEREFKCALEGCKNSFRVKIYPKQRIYPKYCEEHRNPYKREIFLKLIKELKKKK